MTLRLKPLFVAAVSLIGLAACNNDTAMREHFMCSRSESDFIDAHSTKRVNVGAAGEQVYKNVKLEDGELKRLLRERAEICAAPNP